MFDNEFLRDMKLIEEREEYENNFISIPDILKSEELDYYAGDQYEEYFTDDLDCYQVVWEEDYMLDLDMNFDLEDLDKLRDEQLIEMKNAEIDVIYSQIDEYYAEYDPLGAQIEAFDYEPDFECYDEFELFDDYDFFDDCYDDYYVEEYNMEAAYCGNHLLGYIIEDDEFDKIVECDYPENIADLCGGYL